MFYNLTTKLWKRKIVVIKSVLVKVIFSLHSVKLFNVSVLDD